MNITRHMTEHAVLNIRAGDWAVESTVAGSLSAAGSLLSTKADEATVAASLSVVSSALAVLQLDDLTDIVSLTAIGSTISALAVEATVAGSFVATGDALSYMAHESTVAGSLTAVGSDLSTRAVETTVAGSLTAVGSDLSTRAIEATVATSFTATGNALSYMAHESTVAGSLTAVGSAISAIVHDATRIQSVTVSTSAPGDNHVLTFDDALGRWGPEEAAAGGQTLYDYVVAPSGGDYTLVSSAVAAAVSAGGGKTIFVRNGTYNESSDIVFGEDNIVLIGESRDGVIVDFGANDARFEITSDDTQYRTGTVDLTNGDATVTGDGTTFSGNIAAGDVLYVMRSGWVGIVDSITDNTNLELTEAWQGETYSGKTYYFSFTPRTGIVMKNMTITGGTTSHGSIYIENGYRCVLDNVIVKDRGGMGLVLAIGLGCGLRDVTLSNNDHYGGEFATAATDTGLQLAGIALRNVVAENNAESGLVFLGGMEDIQVIGGRCCGNGGTGYHCYTATQSDPNRIMWSQFIGCSSFRNDGYGFDFNTNQGNELSFTGCQADQNGDGDARIAAANTLQTGCNF